ncbi:KICSTOR subunit 2-like [Harmonia axyridis]|uniref:KICSTOR subunit 2-like n=1 Tax=Harmonia axyridis TaxID=115357 RepID=UPI001E2785AD|nr:KICSTOR subunit 2-like [Harmonia axyridis]XP_045479146.1 KICSTOR subunit 2-like [Harmonia axyridis]
MEKEDEFLHSFFTYISQICFDKAKEHIEKEKDLHKSLLQSPWYGFLNFLQQLALSEKSYIEIGFLQTKNKGFLRKDNSLKAIYETMKIDIRKLEENFKVNNKRVQNYCQNIYQFLSAKINLIELYEKIYQMGSGKHLRYLELLNLTENIIQRNALCFTDISLTPVKAVFNLECEILQQLFKALTELQRLQFLPSLALIHGAHTRLTAWEGRIQKESWKLGFLKNNPSPALLQWLIKLKGIVLSKFSLYFHNTLAHQTTPNDMRNICVKLQHDHYQKMVSFQKKYDAAYVILLSDNQVLYDTTDYDSFPIIVSYPPKCPPQLETIMKMISDTVSDLVIVDKIIYKFSTQELRTYVITTVEPNIYLVIIFESKKSEKDAFIENFISEMCVNLRCTKVFTSLKYNTK